VSWLLQKMNAGSDCDTRSSEELHQMDSLSERRLYSQFVGFNLYKFMSRVHIHNRVKLQKDPYT
jgi:hypothetical protein